MQPMTKSRVGIRNELWTQRITSAGEAVTKDESLPAKLRSWVEPYKAKDPYSLDALLERAADEIERLRTALELIGEFDCRPEEHIADLKCWSCYANDALCN